MNEARYWCGLLLGLVGSVALGVRAAAGEAGGDAFSCMHISDIHINPHLHGSAEAPAVRGAATIHWLCAEAGKPQQLPQLGIETPPPSFALATGDLTEYGAIDDTWSVFESAFRDLPCPLYALPGNHDNTWVAMYGIMRERHGGENYSFNRGGCHFICLSSATGQEPVPTIDAKTRAWLAADLKRTPKHMPVFLALHHPLDSGEFANPAERDTVIDMLGGHNVVLLLYGHGHRAVYHSVRGIGGVMGGSTFGEHAGYGLLAVQGGHVRYAYRKHRAVASAPTGTSEGRSAWELLYEAPLVRRAPIRPVSIESPAPGGTIVGRRLAVRLRPQDRPGAAGELQIRLEIDGEPAARTELTDAAPLDVEVSVGDLSPGAHLLTALVSRPESAGRSAATRHTDVRTRVFYVDHPDFEVLWRKQIPAAVKAAPVVLGKLLIVARNDGVAGAVERRTGATRWAFTCGGEILGTPAWSGETLVFGSGDGRVYAVDPHGTQRWVFEAGLPVYGWPLIHDGVVYVGDNGGRLHALRLETGERVWTYERAAYSIEARPALWQDRIVFGAWDGFLYALGRIDGRLDWRSWGPKSSEGRAARYYAPADCGPVALGERLFVCDRGYLLASYSPAGQRGPTLATDVSAIGLSEDGQSLFCRGRNDRVARLDRTGKALWEAAVPAGRFPIPPTHRNERVYVCSNRGLLSVLDARVGRTLGSYQVTPGFYVMAPVSVDAEGVCYVAGMDGSLTALRYRQNTRSTRQGM